jgi:DnaD/phage-associated family protein
LADYWLKLYIEILDDPKMATLPDRLWRRIVELFLMAKRENKDGHLPDTRQIAWALRMSADELDHDLKSIVSTGIIIQEDGGWFIPKFAARQAAVPARDRMAEMRLRNQKRQYDGDVTGALRNVTQSTEAEQKQSRAEADPATAAIFTAYSNNIGQVTKMVSEKIDADVKEYTSEWVIMAIGEAVSHEARNYAYVEAILKNWKINGLKAKSNGNGKNAYGQRKTEVYHDADGNPVTI